MGTILSLPLEKVRPGLSVSNDREYFDPIAIEKLAISIARDGLAQPITVRPIPETDTYQIVAGERRYRAHCFLRDRGCTYINSSNSKTTLPPGEVQTIPAIVRDDLDDAAAAAIMLAENTGRADLNPIEEAKAYRSRKDRFKWSTRRIAEAAGVSPDLVERRLSLLSLIEDIQHLVKHGNIPIGHAEALTPLDENRQRIAIRIYNESPNGLNLNQFKHIINDLLREQQQTSLFDLEVFWVDQVKNDTMPRRGKKAYIPAPTRRDLPPVRRNTKWQAGDIVDQYIADLIRAGHSAEAGAIGNLYHSLVRHNYLATPARSAIPDDGTEYTPHEDRGDDHRK